MLKNTADSIVANQFVSFPSGKDISLDSKNDSKKLDGIIQKATDAFILAYKGDPAKMQTEYAAYIKTVLSNSPEVKEMQKKYSPELMNEKSEKDIKEKKVRTDKIKSNIAELETQIAKEKDPIKKSMLQKSLSSLKTELAVLGDDNAPAFSAEIQKLIDTQFSSPDKPVTDVPKNPFLKLRQ